MTPSISSRALWALGLVALLAPPLSGCCVDTYDSAEEQRVFAIDPADHAADLAACDASDFACEALCGKLIGPPLQPDAFLVITECWVDDLAARPVEVTATYHWTYACSAAGLGPAS